MCRLHESLLPAAVAQMLDGDRTGWRDDNQDLPLFACGISLVVRPYNPMAPTVHLNCRYLEVLDPHSQDKRTNPKVRWFGGGADLTPSDLLPWDPDAQHFHTLLKTLR
ncbi:hypothetical protein PtA15_17A58 [Puccinia triticina]|uniref:coproporphyrinogen oxidase n=1 Tax=Puccinia triticina TaxID=208348 RepID=A0ABY7DCA8_9BASI|nr:uncharacterized protein PtA15_17A58 [Puccinia triticina]WAQ92577.1 hypothetical protein PtA15_17A58 [Puccinia triticina]